MSWFSFNPLLLLECYNLVGYLPEIYKEVNKPTIIKRESLPNQTKVKSSELVENNLNKDP